MRDQGLLLRGGGGRGRRCGREGDAEGRAQLGQHALLALADPHRVEAQEATLLRGVRARWAHSSSQAR